MLLYSVIGVTFIYVAMLLSFLCRVLLSASDPPKLCGAASKLTWLQEILTRIHYENEIYLCCVYIYQLCM